MGYYHDMNDEWSSEIVMQVAAWLLLISSPLAISGAWFVPLLGRVLHIPLDIQFAIIWIMAVIPCLAFVASCVMMPIKYNIRLDLLFYPPILAVVLVNALGVTLLMRKIEKGYGRDLP